MTPAYAYAGIGSRRAKNKILSACATAGISLATMGLTLRSGAAYGCDAAFEQGCDEACGTKEIYIPWGGFNARSIHEPGVIGKEMITYHLAEKVAKAHHPKWSALTPVMKNIMARNSYQVLGQDLESPVLFVLCWTPNGSGQGGTGQAIRIAKAHDIPVFDMGRMAFEDIDTEIRNLLKTSEPA